MRVVEDLCGWLEPLLLSMQLLFYVSTVESQIHQKE